MQNIVQTASVNYEILNLRSFKLNVQESNGTRTSVH